MYFRAWLNRICPPLRKYERFLLDKVADVLPPEARSLFQRQIEAVNLVQRHSVDKEVNLYTIRGGKPSFDALFSFPNSKEDLLLARLSFRKSGESEISKVDVTAVKGRVFSLHFGQSPKGIVDSSSIEVVEVKLLSNPMEAATAARPTAAVNVNWRGWREEWIKNWAVKMVRPPLEPNEREHFLAILETKTPDDYSELLEDCDGFVVERPFLCVLGASEIREVVLETMNVYVLAQGEESKSLAVRRGAFDCRLYFIEHEGGTVEMGSSFRRALEQLYVVRTGT